MRVSAACRPAMVKIIDGEIVPDDDPRLTGRAAGGGSRPAAAAAAAADGGGGPAAAPQQASLFDWNAPPVRVLHEPQGQGVAGLPGLAVYGAPVTSTQLLLLLGAGFFMGLKGLLIGGIVWYVYTSQRLAQQQAGGGDPAGAAQQEQQQRIQSFFSSFMQQEPLGRSSGSGRHVGRAGAGDAPAGPSGAQGSRGADPWEGKGKGYKLNG